MRVHRPDPNHGFMDPAPARYTIRINGHLGATALTAFPAVESQLQGAETVLTGLLDRSALYGVLIATGAGRRSSQDSSLRRSAGRGPQASRAG